MYFPDESLNRSEPILLLVEVSGRGTLVAETSLGDSAVLTWVIQTPLAYRLKCKEVKV
jgi:hypothetical protein